MAEPARAPHFSGQPIMFFDGVCHLCNRSVDFLLRVDRAGRLRFAPIQGETARELLPPMQEEPERWAIFLADEAGLHEASDAVLRICSVLGAPWTLLGVFAIVPRAVRDAAYRFVARSRYRWFGRYETCRLPSAEEKARFLP
jgi:predicted DCC family thiol-disulfide oxidoreductase YuxK